MDAGEGVWELEPGLGLYLLLGICLASALGLLL